MIPVSRPVNANGNIVVFVLEDLTGLRPFEDYIPVFYKETADSDTHDDDGAITVETIADVTGLTAWIDYLPVGEESEDVTKQWLTDAGGYMPVIEEA